MSQPESNRSRKIMAHLRTRGWFCYKNHGSALMMSGLPDIVCCADGLLIGIETKMDGKANNTSVEQDTVRDKIRAAGGVYGVAVTELQAERLVEDALRARNERFRAKYGNK